MTRPELNVVNAFKKYVVGYELPKQTGYSQPNDTDGHPGPGPHDWVPAVEVVNRFLKEQPEHRPFRYVLLAFHAGEYQLQKAFRRAD